MAADTYSIGYDRWAAVSYPGPHMPPRLAIAVTPSDTLDVTDASGDAAPCYASALYIGVTGDVTVVMAADQSAAGAGTAVTYKAVPVGILAVQVRRVMNTNTTASHIVGLYHQ